MAREKGVKLRCVSECASLCCGKCYLPPQEISFGAAAPAFLLRGGQLLVPLGQRFGAAGGLRLSKRGSVTGG